MKLEEIVNTVAAEWQVGGMGPDTLYGEFAIEVAERALALRPEGRAIELLRKAQKAFHDANSITVERAGGRYEPPTSAVWAEIRDFLQRLPQEER